jgi:hypothetical protein
VWDTSIKIKVQSDHHLADCCAWRGAVELIIYHGLVIASIASRPSNIEARYKKYIPHDTPFKHGRREPWQCTYALAVERNATGMVIHA